MLVKVIKSQTSMRQEVFLAHNHLKFERISRGRYRVLRTERTFDGEEEFDNYIGYTFFEAGYHIFVPFPKKCPTSWFFGLSRCDAISGYLSSKEA